LKGRAGRLSRLVPAAAGPAARTPFVLLVVVLLGGGLIALLLVNSALNEGSFKLSELRKRTNDLTDEQQALQRDVDDYSAPGALERRARKLGMVPGRTPVFLNPDGSVSGVPGRAPGPAVVPEALVVPGTPPATRSFPPVQLVPSVPPGPSASGTPSAEVTPAFQGPGGSAPPSVPGGPAGTTTPAPTTSGR
jgi:hypothetical protein